MGYNVIGGGVWADGFTRALLNTLRASDRRGLTLLDYEQQGYVFFVYLFAPLPKLGGPKQNAGGPIMANDSFCIFIATSLGATSLGHHPWPPLLAPPAWRT